MRSWGRKRDGAVRRTPKVVWQEWCAARDSGDAERAGRLAAEMTTVAPDSFRAWFEAGLHAKARRQWARCAEWNASAMGLFGAAEAEEFDGVNPAAWNLGVAATAVGDWDTARRAWSAFGIDGVDGGSGPIDVDFGHVPVRINPDRPSLPLQVVPEYGATEVVWCWRRSPAHAVVASVPLPESGHRFRDVLLHDGEPKGTRRRGEVEISVFDELERLEDSEIPTWQAVVEGVSDDDIGAWGDLAGSRGLGADNWSGMAVLCSDCSHGSPDPTHSHAPAPQGAVTLGLAGERDDLATCLDEWSSTRRGVTVSSLELLW